MGWGGVWGKCSSLYPGATGGFVARGFAQVDLEREREREITKLRHNRLISNMRVQRVCMLYMF